MSEAFNLPRLIQTNLVIPSGQSVTSAPVLLGARSVAWIDTPVGLTGGVLTFQGGNTEATPLELFDSYGMAIALQIPVVGGRHFFNMGGFFLHGLGCRFLWVRAGTSASPAVQAAPRTLTIGAWDPY
jgi:hypothetical protein